MKNLLYTFLVLLLAVPALSQDKLDYLDVFHLEWISDPQISADGQKIIYARNYNDVMTDQRLSNLWIVNFDGSDPRPLTTGNQSDTAHAGRPTAKRFCTNPIKTAPRSCTCVGWTTAPKPN
ncbi:MAG: hypothetical protein SH848_08495 [Saprospiraceae bacterium]|nr:hypothetical protein [Saprospiraceae bacterium]